MKKATKKTVKETIYSVDFEGSLDELLERIQELKRYWDTKYINLFLEKEYWDECEGYMLYGEREETDKEFEKRLAQEAKEKEKLKINRDIRKQQLIKEAKKLGLKVTE